MISSDNLRVLTSRERADLQRLLLQAPLALFSEPESNVILLRARPSQSRPSNP